MRPKLVFKPITPVTNVTIYIPKDAIGYMIEVYHSDGGTLLGRISYNNTSRYIEFNKKKSGGSGHSYQPKYTQQIFITKDSYGLLPTKLTAFSNGGYVKLLGWLSLDKNTKESVEYIYDNPIKQRKNSNEFLINETFIFSFYNDYIKLFANRLIPLSDNISLLEIDKIEDFEDKGYVFYFSTKKEVIVGITVTFKIPNYEHCFLLCKSTDIRPFISSNQTLLPIKTHYGEFTINMEYDFLELMELMDYFRNITESEDYENILSALNIRLANFNKVVGGF